MGWDEPLIKYNNMTSQEFLSKHTNGLYTTTKGFNESYTLRGLVLRSLRNVFKSYTKFRECLVENGQDHISMGNVGMTDDKVAVMNHSEKKVLCTLTYDFLDKYNPQKKGV